MIDNKKLKGIMHFLVHNSVLFTVAIMCLVHVVLLVVMLISDVQPLFFFNILSVVIYLFCLLLCKIGYLLPVYISILLEVTFYASFSSYYLGVKCGSNLFLGAIIPIIIYFGCILFKGRDRILIVFLLLVNFSVFFFSYMFLMDAKPLYEVSASVRSFLLVFAAFVMFFSIIFYNVIYIYSSEYEMNTLEHENEQLSADAKIDLLTNLLNRRGFLPIVENLMNSKPARHFCIAFCDIDNFKRINDTYGHECGDEVLRHITKLIKKEMHGCDICRWGGEEIIVLMKDYDMEVAKQKMEYLRKCVESLPTIFYNQRISATITIGIEEYSEGIKDSEELINIADKRMYYGKQHGKNIVVFDD